MQVTASKEGYKTSSLNDQIGIIVESVNIESLKKKDNSKLPYVAIIAVLVVLIIILLVFMPKKKKSH